MYMSAYDLTRTYYFIQQFYIEKLLFSIMASLTTEIVKPLCKRKIQE